MAIRVVWGCVRPAPAFPPGPGRGRNKPGRRKLPANITRFVGAGRRGRIAGRRRCLSPNGRGGQGKTWLPAAFCGLGGPDGEACRGDLQQALHEVSQQFLPPAAR